MDATGQEAAAVARILHEGLAEAARADAGQVRSEHVSGAAFIELTDASLAYLRSRPGKPSSIEGWMSVSPRIAGMARWWVAVAELSVAEDRRLRQLRQDVYDALEAQGAIRRGSSSGSSIQVSPATDDVPGVLDRHSEDTSTPAADDGDALGAWVLKLSPYVYASHLVFAAEDRLVRRWSVSPTERSAAMQHGHQVFLWVGDGDPLHEPGIWGVGWVTGPCVAGAPDEGWLDHDAASHATLAAAVEIALLDTPVSRRAFLHDPRLAGAEVILEPLSGDLSRFSVAEAAALSEYLAYGPPLPSPMPGLGADISD
ncbi:hypothetical protein ACVW00_001550 [Marmoricola sp. URHA0025 HA25]